MCGIAGEISFTSDVREHQNQLLLMQKVLVPRGPDQKGLYLSPHAGFAHRRLCVIDPDGGKQPMIRSFGGGNYVIVYNGELYNTAQIRSELEQQGAVFTTHSDTEAVLLSYLHWGDACLKKLNGIFAFAIWDENNRRLFAARDRIGVKPFFFAETKGGLLFSSEIKGILAHGAIEPILEQDGVAEILLMGPGRTPGCGVFRDIRELKPGYFLTFGENGLKETQYWKLLDHPFTDSFSQCVEKTRFLVTDAIERQLVSDVPVCTFLSGGLDSSLISSVASRYFAKQGKKLSTFSVGYKDNEKYFKKSKFQPNSDPAYIRIMADYLGSDHHDVILDTPELVRGLYDAVDARDLPGMADVDSSLLLFCREIKKTGTVALSGECADEIFGGYPWYRDPQIRSRYGFPWAQTTDYRMGFLRDEWAQKIDGHAYVDARYRATLAQTDRQPGLSETENRMKEMMNLNVHWFMQTLLDRKDRMSMATGLEVRVPFCDYRIAEYLYTVPWEFKDYNHTEKGLLREAMKDYLPDEVLWRKKSPYPKTHHPAYRAAVEREMRETILSDPNAPILQLVKRDALTHLLEESNPTPWYGQLMNTPQTIAYLLQVNYWLQKYRVDIR